MSIQIQKKPLDISVIGASAGTGKTTRLTQEFIDAIVGVTGVYEPIDPASILVCTFTNKAAEELSARIRERLIEEGKWLAAQQVLIGYIGTVNSVCGRLLIDYAMEAGQSPRQNVIPAEIEKQLFNSACAGVLDSYAERLDAIAIRLAFDETPKASKHDRSQHWHEHVNEVCKIARGNRIDPGALAAQAQRSWACLKSLLLPVASVDATDLDRQLLHHLTRAIRDLEASTDTTKKTATALEKLKDYAIGAKVNRLTWADWAGISKIDPAKNSLTHVRTVVEVASRHPEHPQLHDDLEQFITLIFQCAADALGAYQEFKAKAGLIDFTDQEYQALELMDNDSVRESLKSRIQLALIDEFQDTSPIQLALFAKLGELADRSIWVGDIKQAIYGFRGTDPQLMQLAANTFTRRPALKIGYRSRPGLVAVSNDIFKRVFPSLGITADDVVIRSHQEHNQTDEPAIELWRCKGSKLEECYGSLASGIVQLLSRSNTFHVGDSIVKKDGRPVVGSDIAILCLSNSHCASIAAALSAAGLKVAMTREGLLDTPECLLAFAALRYLADKRDTLALAQITHLNHDYSDAKAPIWLEPWLTNSQLDIPVFPHIEAFDKMREKLPTSTVPEALQMAVNCADVTQAITKWGRVRERMANLDAFFGIVREYESSCELTRSATTPAGFISYIENLKEECGQPASSDPDAVKILTYHKSKGLEWPVVVLADLDKSSDPIIRKDLCKVSVEPSDESFDIEDPLKGRWIRFWPWPYGNQTKDVHLDVSATESPEYQRTAKRLFEEHVRLLYVGITRARDLLVLAPYVKGKSKSGSEWLEELKEEAIPVIQFPAVDTGLGVLRIGDSEHAIGVHTIDGPHEPQPQIPPTIYSPVRGERRYYPPYVITPSKASSLEVDMQNLDLPIIDIGSRIPIIGAVDMAALGDCVHRFLAADDVSGERTGRMELAKNIRTLWSISHITPESLIEMSDRLNQFLLARFAGAQRFRECPVSAVVDSQRVHGVIDLLVEMPSDLQIVDHKTFPGRPEQWTIKAVSFVPQLRLYADCLRRASDKSIGGAFIHMPIIGKVIDISKALI